MLDAELLKLLRCPETQQPLRLVGPDVLSELNRQVEAGTLNNRGGQPIREKLESGLLREDGQWLYPVRDNIPIMLINESVRLPSVQRP